MNVPGPRIAAGADEAEDQRRLLEQLAHREEVLPEMIDGGHLESRVMDGAVASAKDPGCPPVGDQVQGTEGGGHHADVPGDRVRHLGSDARSFGHRGHQGEG